VKGTLRISEHVSKSFDFNLATINFGAIISGKMPKPIYLEGYVHCDYTILEIVSGSADFSFQKGNNCNIVAN
jgi:hypothetical protein